MKFKNTLFVFFTIVVIAIFYAPLRELLILALRYNELYSHMVLIPFVSGYFLYKKRRTIFSDTTYSYLSGITLIAIGLLIYLIVKNTGNNLKQNDYLSLMSFSAIITLIGGFIFFFGIKAAREASFPLLFLLFMIPIPSIFLNKIIFLLQSGSTEAANMIFSLTGIPFVRDGNVFHLHGLSVKVAEECSGIRSSLALFITSIIAGQLFLKTGWKRLILSLSIFPITVFKNGLRVVTLSLLGAYIDERILSTTIHTRGGIPFFILALSLFAPVLWFLQRSEKRDSI